MRPVGDKNVNLSAYYVTLVQLTLFIFALVQFVKRFYELLG